MALRAARRLVVSGPRSKRGIEGRCVHPLLQLLPHVPYHIEKLAYISAVERRYRHYRGKGEDREKEAHAVLDGFHLIRDPLEEVRLVKHEYDALSSPDDQIGDLLILLGQPLRHIHHQQDDIRLVYRLYRPVDRIVFDILFDLALAPDACRIEDGILRPLIDERTTHDIARGAGNRRDDGDIAAGEEIRQCALAGIRLAEDGDPDRLGLLGDFLRTLEVEHAEEGILQLLDAEAMRRRDADHPLVSI